MIERRDRICYEGTSETPLCLRLCFEVKQFRCMWTLLTWLCARLLWQTYEHASVGGESMFYQRLNAYWKRMWIDSVILRWSMFVSEVVLWSCVWVTQADAHHQTHTRTHTRHVLHVKTISELRASKSGAASSTFYPSCPNSGRSQTGGCYL